MAPAGPVLCVVGARPNYMKMAPLLRAFKACRAMPPAVLIHTGQHYDFDLNDRLFIGLDLPAPDINLEVGSGSHAIQTAEVMKRFEPVIDQSKPSCVVVVGDVNSTLACSLVASKKSIPVVHVEAGLRSFDRSMPEEINRVLTDQLANVLYTTERGAQANLVREGISEDRIQFVGNLMIDSLHAALPRAVPALELFGRVGIDAAWASAQPGYAAVTLHRPSNVDDPRTLADIVAIFGEVGQRMPVIWPVHPRTRANIEKFGLSRVLQQHRVVCLPPQGYLEMVSLMRSAALVLTDSGGVQEETTALGVPCLTMRTNTERPITVDQGTNTLVGIDRGLILAAVDDVLRSGGKRGRIPEYWDGGAAPRIASHMAQWLAASPEASVHR